MKHEYCRTCCDLYAGALDDAGKRHQMHRRFPWPMIDTENFSTVYDLGKAVLTEIRKRPDGGTTFVGCQIDVLTPLRVLLSYTLERIDGYLVLLNYKGRIVARVTNDGSVVAVKED